MQLDEKACRYMQLDEKLYRIMVMTRRCCPQSCFSKSVKEPSVFEGLTTARTLSGIVAHLASPSGRDDKVGH